MAVGYTRVVGCASGRFKACLSCPHWRGNCSRLISVLEHVKDTLLGEKVVPFVPRCNHARPIRLVGMAETCCGGGGEGASLGFTGGPP